MGIKDFLFGKDNNPEKTIVYMREVSGHSPARYWESVVDYDAWGQPFAYDYNFGLKTPENLKPDGRYGSYSWCNWKHKSGPPVRFEKVGDPQRTWFPPNPNDKLPLN